MCVGQDELMENGPRLDSGRVERMYTFLWKNWAQVVWRKFESKEGDELGIMWRGQGIVKSCQRWLLMKVTITSLRKCWKKLPNKATVSSTSNALYQPNMSH